MFTRGSRRRRSERAAQDPERGRPCRVCRELCPGFQEHPWRKLCQHCKCPRGEHVGGGVPPALQGVLARLLPESHPPPGSEDSGCSADEFAWAPPGLSPDQVCQYFSLLPPALVPRLRSPGERHRLRELLRQLPPHDLEPQFCHDLDEAERRELKLFAQRRKRENLGQGSVRPLPLTSEGAVCQQCGAAVRGGALAVFAARAGLGLCWHPRCFRCQQCQQPLVDLIYFCPGDSGGARLLCGRHHGDSVRHRCPGCDELIFGGPCAEAGGRRWHLRHLRCLECEGALDPQTVPGGEGQPLCPPCRARRAHLCDTCGDPIGLQDPHVTHRGQHWHPLPGCFRCAPCGRPLLGRPFLPRGGQIFCSPAANSPGHRSAPRRRSWGGAPPAGWQPRFRRGGPDRHSLPELGAAPRPAPTGPAPTGPAPPPPGLPPSAAEGEGPGPSPLAFIIIIIIIIVITPPTNPGPAPAPAPGAAAWPDPVTCDLWVTSDLCLEPLISGPPGDLLLLTFDLCSPPGPLLLTFDLCPLRALLTFDLCPTSGA
ncbi:LOW QUALITY PROTEIN: prickle planar cell polarity protein 3-like [Melospiza melodia melodia]|uniref:LOW QUALITY PROTEIN: prickle planar cell polarity protein 3-like n=1 Tax=Melospiza melodia melodia TaxID=1914991 RepID=UPI002FD59873